MGKTSKSLLAYADDQTGMVLPATVWFIMVFFLITSAVLNLTLGQKRFVSAGIAQYQMELVAEAAFASEIKRLLDSNDSEATSKQTFGNFTVEIAASNEAGKINLNLADEELLMALFSEYDFSASEAKSLVAEILDERANGIGLKTLDELVGFQEVTIERFAGLRVDITIFSDSPRVNPDYASETVLKILAVNGDEFVKASQSILKPKEFETGNVWRITAQVKDGLGKSLTFEKTIRLTGMITNPYIVHASQIIY